MEQGVLAAGKAAGQKRPLSARRAAAAMLLTVCEDKKFSGEVKENYLPQLEDRRERALAVLLFEGCLERLIEIDYIIDSFSKLPVRKMKPAVAAILRITVYQLKFTDKIPASAACNEAVNLAKTFGLTGLSGFVNGVARAIARAETIHYPPKEKGFKEYCSKKYSMPTTIVEILEAQYGAEQTEKICKAFLEDQKEISAYCITSSIDVESLLERENAEGSSAEKGQYGRAAIRFGKGSVPEDLPGFAEGLFYIMDESSMQAVFAAGITGGETVLDLCGAPGGKTIVAADLLRKGGTVISRDLTEKKTRLILENKKRCRLDNIEVQTADAAVFYEEDAGKYDIVLADVPCSGLGIIGKKPDIKLFFEKKSLKELSLLQRSILQNAARYVKPGGVLVFSTCTINREENMGGFEYLRSECGMLPESLDPYISEKLWGETTGQGYLQMLPDLHHTDGFFVARFRKPEE